MPSFKGNYSHKMDSNGRVALPKAFAERIGDMATLVKGKPNALYVIPEKEFDTWVQSGQLYGPDGYVPANPKHREMRDRIYGGSHDAPVDSAKRISIPKDFQGAAGLKPGLVTFVGQKDMVELWDTKAWEEHIGAVPTVEVLRESL